LTPTADPEKNWQQLLSTEMAAGNFQWNYAGLQNTQNPLVWTKQNALGNYQKMDATVGPIWSIWHGRRLGENDMTTAESINIDVEFYGTPCMNPGRHPKSPTQRYPLSIVSGSGCATTAGGSDPMAELADSDTELNFLYANDDLAINFENGLPHMDIYLGGTQQFNVGLYNRRRILVQSTQLCDAFRFNKNNQANQLLAEYDSIWDLISGLAIVSASTSILALMMVLLVILEGYDRQTQAFMTALYTICLVGLFCSAVMVWKAQYAISTTYAKHYSVFVKAKGCITNAKWEGVLDAWLSHTSFGNFGEQLAYCVWLFVAMLVIAVVFAIYSLMKLA
jgi:hypothetical protein